VVVPSAVNTLSVEADSLPSPYYTHTPPPPSVVTVVVQAHSQHIPYHSLSVGNLLAARSNPRRGVYVHGTRGQEGSENEDGRRVEHMGLVGRGVVVVVAVVVVGNRSIGKDSLLLRMPVEGSIRDDRAVSGNVDGGVEQVVRDGSNRRSRGTVGGNVLLVMGIVRGVVDNGFEIVEVVVVEIDVLRVGSTVFHLQCGSHRTYTLHDSDPNYLVYILRRG